MCQLQSCSVLSFVDTWQYRPWFCSTWGGLERFGLVHHMLIQDNLIYLSTMCKEKTLSCIWVMLCDLQLVDDLRLCISTICRISLNAELVVWLAHYVAALNVPKYVTRVMTASWSAPLLQLTVTAGKSASAKPWLWASKRLVTIFCVGLSRRLIWFHSRTAGKRLYNLSS